MQIKEIYGVPISKSCPICNKGLTHDYTTYKVECYCLNSCYKFYYKIGHTRHEIFDRTLIISFYNDDAEAQRVKDELIKLIDYWRENDRYLMKLLDK